MCMDPQMIAGLMQMMQPGQQMQQPGAEYIPVQSATPGAPRPVPEEAGEPMPRPPGSVPMLPGR
jgi:hypothetical protein